MSLNYIKPKLAEIKHPLIMFKLAKSYKKGMEPWQLYAVTRGQWKMSIKKAKDYKYALACDAGLVVEVYEIESWHPCNETMNEQEKEYRKANKLFAGEEGRIEFVGKIAADEIKKQYFNSNVVKYWGKSQTPFKYIDSEIS
ncbi:MAG: hypothetical protein ACYCZ2_01555 [Lutibacter sp.]